MALIDPCLYLQADAHPARTFRQLITAVLGEGILGSTSFAVTQRGAGANFSVDVAAGMGIVTGDSATQQGRYLCVNDATVNDATTVITSAPSAGNERYDRVILEVKDNAEDAGGLNLPRFRVVPGTPAAVGTATAPALPNTAITLAIVGPIVNGTTTITNSLITDGRTAARLANQVVDTAAIVDANVTSAKILDGTIVAGDLASSVLSGGWSTLSLGSGWSGSFQYKRLGDVLTVAVNITAASPATTVGTLPVGFRPATTWQLPILVSGSTPGVFQIATSGAVTHSLSPSLSAPVYAMGVFPV